VQEAGPRIDHLHENSVRVRGQQVVADLDRLVTGCRELRARLLEIEVIEG